MFTGKRPIPTTGRPFLLKSKIMAITEAQAIAGIAVLVNQLGLDSTDTINLAVSGSDNFQVTYGANGISSINYGNSQISVLSKDKVYIYGGGLLVVGFILAMLLKK